MLLDGTGSGLEVPVLDTHEQIHAGTAAALVILATALVAEPGAGAALIIEAVAIGATAERAGLMTIGELISGEAAKILQQVRPPAVGEVLDFRHRAVRRSGILFEFALDQVAHPNGKWLVLVLAASLDLKEEIMRHGDGAVVSLALVHCVTSSARRHSSSPPFWIRAATFTVGI